MYDKRVDAFLRQEMAEHQKVISSHHQEMQTLRNSLSLAMDRFSSISFRCESELQDLKQYASNHILLIKDRLMDSEKIISDQKKTIQSLHDQIQDFQAIHVTKNDVDIFQKQSDCRIKESTTSHLKAFQDFQSEMKSLFQLLKDDLDCIRKQMNENLSILDSKFEIKASSSRVDRDRILKEIHEYEHTIFVIQKKIENIYTLIERIHKRG